MQADSELAAVISENQANLDFLVEQLGSVGLIARFSLSNSQGIAAPSGPA